MSASDGPREPKYTALIVTHSQGAQIEDESQHASQREEPDIFDGYCGRCEVIGHSRSDHIIEVESIATAEAIAAVLAEVARYDARLPENYEDDLEDCIAEYLDSPGSDSALMVRLTARALDKAKRLSAKGAT